MTSAHDAAAELFAALSGRTRTASGRRLDA